MTRSLRLRATRCAAVWLVITTVSGLLTWLALPALARTTTTLTSGDPSRVSFSSWLSCLAALAWILSAGWLWVRGSLIAGEALRAVPRDRSIVESGLRRLVLAACGVALLPVTVTTAHAETGHVGCSPASVGEVVRLLEGLPLPDRAESGPPARSSRRTPVLPRRAFVVVAPGDTLWGLADSWVASSATPAAVTAGWHALYRANRAVIGADPDLIRPGQSLRLPDPRPHDPAAEPSP